jgi:RNA polymerase sigma-70 factor (ECF subfamily)
MRPGTVEALFVTGEIVPPGSGADEPSTSLLVNARNGDPRAWERLVSLTTPLVLYWCCRGVPAADAQDVGQEVFCAVARALGAFRRNRPRDSFRGWLRTITRNKVRDYWKRQRAAGPVGEGGSDAQARLQQVAAEESSDDDGPADADEKRLLYRRAVELLESAVDAKTWQAFCRVEIEGRAAAEVAAALGMSVNAVYLAKGRVRKRLREEFADLLDE